MEIDKTLQVKLELEKLIFTFQEEQKSKYSVLNETQETVNAKKKELEKLSQIKQEQFKKLPGLKEGINEAKEDFDSKGETLAVAMNEKLQLSIPTGGWGPILIEYKEALSKLHDKLNEPLLALEREEKIYNDILIAEEKLNKTIEALVQTEINLMEQCDEKLQETKEKIIELLQSNFQGSDVLKEQLDLLKKGMLSVNLGSDKSEVVPKKSQQTSSVDSLQEALRKAKRKFVFGLRQIDDLTNQNTMIGSLTQPFFASPLKFFGDITSGGNKTGVLSISAYVPVVKVAVTQLNQLLSKNVELNSIVQEEQTRGAELEKRLELALKRIEELEKVQRTYELQTSEFSQFRETQEVELKKAKKALTEKSFELTEALKTIQELKDAQVKLTITCDSLLETCSQLKKSELEKTNLLQAKELLINGLRKNMEKIYTEKHETEDSLQKYIETLIGEKEELAQKLRNAEQQLKLAQEQKRDIEKRLKEQMQKLSSANSENVVNQSSNSPRKPLTLVYDRTVEDKKKEGENNLVSSTTTTIKTQNDNVFQ